MPLSAYLPALDRLALLHRRVSLAIPLVVPMSWLDLPTEKRTVEA